MMERNHTIFIGNPGVGKSTLLNALVGRLVFQSGTTFGKGLTRTLQLHVDSTGHFWLDTPGLNDIQSRRVTADQISKALRSGDGNYKLIFVVTCRGRVNSNDLETIRLVLDSLPNTSQAPYGIIVNKVSKAFRAKLSSSQEGYERFLTMLHLGDGYRIPEVLLYENRAELEDEDNVLHSPSPELVNFVATVGSLRIKPESVRSVQHKDEDEIRRRLRAQKRAAEDAEVGATIGGVIVGIVAIGLMALVRR